jgi:hypothetical protein
MTYVFLFLFFAGCTLLYHLGSGRVPGVLKPLANVWVQTGYDPKWINVGLWILFAFLAVPVLLFVGIPLYSVVVHLGRGFK